MQTKGQMVGQWYEFNLDLFIPDSVDYPKDWGDFIRWLAKGDNGTFVTGVSLVNRQTNAGVPV